MGANCQDFFVVVFCSADAGIFIQSSPGQEARMFGPYFGMFEGHMGGHFSKRGLKGNFQAFKIATS